MKQFLIWLGQNADDLLLLAGFGLILAGSYQIHPTLTWFVGGAECLVEGWLLARSREHDLK